MNALNTELKFESALVGEMRDNVRGGTMMRKLSAFYDSKKRELYVMYAHIKCMNKHICLSTVVMTVRETNSVILNIVRC